MSNVTSMPLSVLEQAKAEVSKEKAEKAKKALVVKLRELDAAQAVVKGIELSIEDLNMQISDGTFR